MGGEGVGKPSYFSTLPSYKRFQARMKFQGLLCITKVSPKGEPGGNILLSLYTMGSLF